MVINEHISGTIECRNQTYELNDSNVISASNKRLACREGAFEIGGVYAATLSLTCRLKDAKRFSLRGAKIKLYSQYGTEEKPYCIGTFWAVNVRKTGDIFTIDAQDAIGWTDVSSYNGITQDGVKTMGTCLKEFQDYHIAIYYQYPGEYDTAHPTIMEWFNEMTKRCNEFLEAQTGIKNLLSWKNYEIYSNPENIYFGNSHLWRNDGDGWHPKNALSPPIYLDNGCADSDCPRDFFRYLAEFTAGFVYAEPESGSLTLGQFGMVSPGRAEIFMNEIEADSLEIADYTIQLHFVYAYGENAVGQWKHGWKYTENLNHEENVYIHWDIEANPFIDGFANYLVTMPQMNDSMFSITQGLWEAFYHESAVANGVPGIEELREQSKFTVRPFQCKVHAPKRFALGQQIRIHDDQDYDSIITSIQWMFRGGHQIACGGEDSRVMADCLRASKSDKALKETRNRCAAIEQKIANLQEKVGI